MSTGDSELAVQLAPPMPHDRCAVIDPPCRIAPEYVASLAYCTHHSSDEEAAWCRGDDCSSVSYEEVRVCGLHALMVRRWPALTNMRDARDAVE